MPKEGIIWRNKKAAELYYKEVAQKSSGMVDEGYISKYIRLKKEIKAVSLGIGVGRELSWLSKLDNIKEIIGIDYSQEELDFCKKVAEKYKVKVSLVKDNLLSLNKFKNLIKNEKLPLIYVCLINTLGNFNEKERGRVLKNIKKLTKKKDRLILSLYKRPERIKVKTPLPSQIKVGKDPVIKTKLRNVIEYTFYEFFWPPLLEKYHQLPRFWYDDKANNMTVYVGKKKILISHRFSKEEIIEMAKKAKFKTEKLIERKFMWIAILKI